MILSQSTRGIVLMIAAMAAFALADALVKLSASDLLPAQVLLCLMGGGLFMFAFMAKWAGHRFRDPRAFSPVMLLRYLSEVVGMVSMVLALTHAPLSTVGAITQATPILVVVGAVVFLGERVSWRRWTCIAIGFVGVLLIVQPGTAAFEPSVLWGVLAMVALAVRDLTTRMVPADMPSTIMATYTMIAAVPFPVLWLIVGGHPLLPQDANWGIIVPMILFGSVGYILLIASIRMTDVSIVMPFRYSRIIFLFLLGVIVFDEQPNALMIVGALLVVGSGIYMMMRQRLLG
ncbi:DMT family transporter [Rhizobiaceae bacterium]|nr:DMT family transporter [Rhizobiaceae bacterium]